MCIRDSPYAGRLKTKNQQFQKLLRACKGVKVVCQEYAPSCFMPVSYTHLVQRAESKYVKATADYHFRMAAQEHPEMSGNPVSRMWRKRRLKKQYQKRAREAVKAGAKVAGFVKRHPVGVLLALACVLLLFMMQSCSSSLVMLGNSGAGAVGATT